MEHIDFIFAIVEYFAKQIMLDDKNIDVPLGHYTQ